MPLARPGLRGSGSRGFQFERSGCFLARCHKTSQDLIARQRGRDACGRNQIRTASFVPWLTSVLLCIDVTDYAAPMRSLPTKIGVAPTFNQITGTASRGEVIGLAARGILEWLYRRRASQPLARRWRNAAGKPAGASTSRPRRRGRLSGLIGWPWQNSGSAPRNGWRLTLRWINGRLELQASAISRRRSVWTP